MIQLNYRYRIQEDNDTYNGTHLFDPNEFRDDRNNDWNIIEDMLQEQYKGEGATIKVLEVTRD